MSRRRLALLAAAAGCALLAPVAGEAGWGKPAPLPDWVLQAAAVPTPESAASAPALTLLQDDLITVDPRGQSVLRHREVIRILKPQGRSYATLYAPSTSDSKLAGFHAWSIGADHRQYTVRDEEVGDYGIEDGGMLYVDDRYKEVTPPAADPGGVVAYEYTRQIPSYFSEASWDFQGELPALRSSFEVDLPPGWKHEAVWCRHAPEAAQQVAPNHFRWQLDSVERIDRRDQPLAPSPHALAGRMVVHYAATDLPQGDALWARVGNFYQVLASPSTESHQDITAAARQLASPNAELTTRLESVAAFMQQQIRYVGIEIGIGGWRPHAAEDIYKNRYGDCKDKATLLISMLDALGVRATWVLVDTHRGFVDPAAPSIAGNHAIAAIEVPKNYAEPSMQAIVTAKNGRRYLIFDPTNEYVPLGSLPEYLQGGYGTLVLGPESQVIQLPIIPPTHNVFERKAHFTLAADGSLEGKVIESSLGASSGEERKYLVMASEKQQRERLEQRLHRDLASFSVGDPAAENIRKLNQPLTMTYALTAPQYAKTAGSLLLVRPRVLGSVAEPFESKPRHYPVSFETEGTWKEETEITLPGGYTVDELPQPVALETAFANYHSEVKEKSGALQYTREYVVKAISLPASEYPSLRTFEQTVLADEQQSAVLKRQ
ncbi:MAG TPA: DUF3857 domain-containing transglutaminase family protein [Acidobacteriaceae bacterium]